MPVKKQDVHRALVLLKEYQGQLTSIQDRSLQAAMDHVIFIFKGHLFQALLDVQEYYEITLLNDIQPVQQEAFDNLVKLETELPTEPHLLSASLNSHSVASEEPLPFSSPSDTVYQNVCKIKDQELVTSDKKDEFLERWDYEEISLERGAAGLGFSIAGGTDIPHAAKDPSIYVTKVITGGAAFADGRLRVNDIIVSVNGISTVGITHAQSVEALKNAGRSIQLVVKRLYMPSEEDMRQTDLEKNTSAFIDQRSVAGNHSTENAIVQSSAIRSDKISRNQRRVFLQKGPTGFGFNIVGGEDGEGIFVSFIMAGGPADRSDQLHKGDQLISVNGIDIQEATHEQAAAALKGAGEYVEIVLQYKPDEYRHFETKINALREQMMIASTGSSVAMTATNRSSFVRALFDYNPIRDSEMPGRGLSFHFGDVLHVINNLDEDEWWQAQKVFPEDDAIGYIPSKRRVEMSARLSFKRATDGKKKKMKKSKKTGNREEEMNYQLVSRDDSNIFSYQSVTKREANYVRPLIVLGPLRDRIYDALISEFPNSFGSCIPHTTRPKKEHEVDGRDYHFVASREEMEHDIENHLFVEAGQYSDNLYGTSIQSVKDVAANGKHCILDIGVGAIVRLQSVGLYPITIFIKPRSIESLLQWNITQEDVQEMFNKALHIEKEFVEHFTAVVCEETPDEIFQEVNRIIDQHSGPITWISNDVAQC